jgi:hypothetical protein
MIQWLAQHGIHTNWPYVIGNLVLWMVLAFNIWNSFRLRRRSREMLAIRDDLMQGFVESMTEITFRVCPFCAVAAGRGEATETDECDRQLGKIEADEEFEGWHEIRPPNRTPGKVPCPAYPLRQAARKCFADMMKLTVKK